MNPYKVLGVSENATQEELRAAYLTLVKKYHPDKYPDNDLKEMANEKLKEINEAYDILTKNGGQTNGGWSSQGGYRTASAGARTNTYSGQNAAEFIRARSCILAGNLTEAVRILDSMPLRNAEWYFLYGNIYMRQGWYDKARESFRSAYEMEPDNSEYRTAYYSLSGGARVRYNPNAGAGICSSCSLCSLLACTWFSGIRCVPCFCF